LICPLQQLSTLMRKALTFLRSSEIGCECQERECYYLDFLHARNIKRHVLFTITRSRRFHTRYRIKMRKSDRRDNEKSSVFDRHQQLSHLLIELISSREYCQINLSDIRWILRAWRAKTRYFILWIFDRSFHRPNIYCYRNGREWFCKRRHNDDREEIRPEIVGDRTDSGWIWYRQLSPSRTGELSRRPY